LQPDRPELQPYFYRALNFPLINDLGPSLLHRIFLLPLIPESWPPMSFGWSAGDIVAALKLLQQIVSAIRDSGEDFQDTLSFLQTLSRTLEHLNALQAISLDPELVDNLREQCDHIRAPLAAFLNDVGGRFGPALGVSSRRNRIFSASRRIQWAFSISKKTKRLQDRIAVPIASVGLILGQQIV
jgi:hypothetical protein